MVQMTEPKLLVRDGKLHYSFTLNGKRIRKSLNLNDTIKNRNLVNNKIFPQLKSDIHSGVFFNKAIPTVDEYSKVSFENHKFDRRKATISNYSSMLRNHIIPYFGSRKLNEISVTDVNNWKNSLYIEKKLSSKAVNDIKNLLGSIFNDAVNDEIIIDNPIRKSKPLPQHYVKEIFPFSFQEISSILNSCNGQNKNIISALFFLGIRTGECIGLKWIDVDFKKRTIHIRRSIRKGVEGIPKTKSSIRIIDMTDKVISCFENQYKLTGEKNTYVFLNKIDNPYYDSNKLRDKMWKDTLEKAKVPYRTIYQTRHTFCSLNLQEGEDVLWISKVMGHSSPRTTLEKYSKFVPRKAKKTSIFDILM